MPQSITYKDAGVDIDAGNDLVNQIKNVVKSTYRPEVLGELGGFAGCFAPNLKNLHTPVLVSATDGVGTKLRLAIEHQKFEGIGIDLVAMCVNDLIVMGAEPLFFLDYYASGKLETAIAVQVIKSIAAGCQLANIALIGGETAEMPGMYQKNDFDLAGFCVGIVDKPKIVDGRSIVPGDTLIALASSGVHSNGYSLVRKLLENTTPEPDFIEKLLCPTKIYVKTLLDMAQKGILKGAAHITGGGLSENIPRMLPDHCAATLIQSSWQLPDIFQWLKTQSHLPFHEFQRIFNCGVGMVCCVSSENAQIALDIAATHGDTAWIIGYIDTHPEKVVHFA